MTAREMLLKVIAANSNPMRTLAEDIMECLPYEFEMKAAQIRVVCEFLGDYSKVDHDPQQKGWYMQRSLYTMQITNFITLNCRRISGYKD